MFGAFYGDVIGSEYENACTKDYDFPFKRESHFTDDSVMTAAVCRAILNNGEKIGRFGIRKRAFEYAAQYKQYYSRYPHAGYGSMFARWAKEKSLRRQYSYANGGAMRAVPIGYAYLLDDTHYSIGEEMDDIIDNEVNDEYPIKPKIPLTKQEYCFLPDEGDHIIYSLFHADRHTGLTITQCCDIIISDLYA